MSPKDPNYQTWQAERHRKWGGDFAGCYRQTCRVCEGVFYSGSPNTAHCSKKCQSKGNRVRLKVVNARIAKKRAAARAANPKIAACRKCGKAFIIVWGQSYRYCSPECARARKLENDKMYNRRKRAIRAAARAANPKRRLCPICGKPFSVKQRKTLRYCSPEHARAGKVARGRMYRLQKREKLKTRGPSAADVL
jgi:hypothetical protein